MSWHCLRPLVHVASRVPAWSQSCAQHLRCPASLRPVCQVIIKRPRLILRGDGSASTILKVDSPLKDIPGVPKPKGGYGFYNQGALLGGTGVIEGLVEGLGGTDKVQESGSHRRSDTWPAAYAAVDTILLHPTCVTPPTEAFINFRGSYLADPALTTVTGTAARGTKLITVADASKLRVGQYVVLILSDKGGTLNRYL